MKIIVNILLSTLVFLQKEKLLIENTFVLLDSPSMMSFKSSRVLPFIWSLEKHFPICIRVRSRGHKDEKDENNNSNAA